jgi:hypothetical protein
MVGYKRSRVPFVFVGAAMAIGTTVLLVRACPAKAEDLGAGRTIWSAKAGCSDCHG